MDTGTGRRHRVRRDCVRSHRRQGHAWAAPRQEVWERKPGRWDDPDCADSQPRGLCRRPSRAVQDGKSEAPKPDTGPFIVSC